MEEVNTLLDCLEFKQLSQDRPSEISIDMEDDDYMEIMDCQATLINRTDDYQSRPLHSNTDPQLRPNSSPDPQSRFHKRAKHQSRLHDGVPRQSGMSQLASGFKQRI